MSAHTHALTPSKEAPSLSGPAPHRPSWSLAPSPAVRGSCLHPLDAAIHKHTQTHGVLAASRPQNRNTHGPCTDSTPSPLLEANKEVASPLQKRAPRPRSQGHPSPATEPTPNPEPSGQQEQVCTPGCTLYAHAHTHQHPQDTQTPSHQNFTLPQTRVHTDPDA